MAALSTGRDPITVNQGAIATLFASRFTTCKRTFLSVLQVWILGDDISKKRVELGFLSRESMLGNFSDEVLDQIAAPLELILAIMEWCKRIQDLSAESNY